ncbi:hypothetical protein GCM10010306_021560 [Streptomyces umbrinus]|uniref:hypothetical protein n=1 Tax=Streptomyces umbrinus TaxID=67370 RepID=UPI00198E9484|nr:hypothetical protein [Streptomyces umbrinus]GHB28859.1 hypothetical protein GCM10010306_021560 [Streptomyces umbrinus]
MSHVYTTLGDTRRAHESQQRALELSAPTSSMTRTLLHLDAAACAHHDGDTEQACPGRPQHSTHCRTTSAPPWSVGARWTYEAVPAQHHRERAVRELRRVLAA